MAENDEFKPTHVPGQDEAEEPEAMLAGLDAVTNQEAASGLKSALEQGSSAAVDLLGKTDGFYGNNAVKIPLPDSLKKTQKLMRGLGFAVKPFDDDPDFKLVTHAL